MKKLILLAIAIGLFTGIDSFAYRQETPSIVVAQLYRIYKSNDFRTGRFISVGKEKKIFEKIIKMRNSNFGRPPKQLALFIARIENLKIINEEIKGNIARVDAIWVLKIRDSKNRYKYQYKVNEVAYLLQKIRNKWFLRSSRFLNQHILYNYADVQRKYKKAIPYDAKIKSSKRGRRQRGYRRRTYRR